LVDAVLLAVFWPAIVAPRGHIWNWWKRALGLELLIRPSKTAAEASTSAEGIFEPDRPLLLTRLAKARGSWPLFFILVMGPLVSALGIVGVWDLPRTYSEQVPAAAKFAASSVSAECLRAANVQIQLVEGPQDGLYQIGRVLPSRLMNLSLDELILTQGEVKPEVLAKLDDGDAAVANTALTQISGISLKNADLRGASLVRARLPRADLRNARLQGANLEEARLQGADLSGAQLMGANLSGARLEGANLSDSDLRGANLSAANFRNASMNNANLQGVY
jgi:uncharacterized protein YjbI with pentapeptide repeats